MLRRDLAGEIAVKVRRGSHVSGRHPCGGMRHESATNTFQDICSRQKAAPEGM
jgi:hypothetical protein